MNDTLIEKPGVIARFRLRGMGTESTETPSRLRAPNAAVAPFENEIVDWGQPALEPEQALRRRSVLTKLIDRTSELGKLRKGWNSYSAPAPTAAAIGNAIFDATGARIRQIPFTPERVKAALGRVNG